MSVESIELRSQVLSVEVLPRLGGRLASLRDLTAAREWLWSNEQLGRYAVEPYADYDSNWQGGWEELFPNDAATTLDGAELPDHGELWSVPWEVVSSSDRRVTLRTTGYVTGVVVTKSITVDAAAVTIEYTLDHRGDTDLPYLFKLHPAVSVHGRCRLEMPGGTIEPVDPSFSSILPGDGERRPWPGPAGHDVAQCHDADSGLREFVYVHDVPEGRVGVLDEAVGRRLTIEYPTEVFEWCWLFLTYGGWQGLHVAVLEPCTTHPKDLHTAIAAGTTPVLPAGGSRSFTVTCTVTDA